MAIRLRHTEDAGLIAICAARSVPKEGDVYLDDGAHHALSVKFGDDFASMGLMNPSIADATHPDTLMRAAMEREESNNANRDEWDKVYANG